MPALLMWMVTQIKLEITFMPELITYNCSPVPANDSLRSVSGAGNSNPFSEYSMSGRRVSLSTMAINGLEMRVK